MNTTRPSLPDLACMAALFETGSVTAAARQVGVSQPALSHALARLRAAFGDPLFVKAGARMVPTARAQALRERLSAALRAVEAIADSEAFDPARSDRAFRIATADYLQSLLLPPLAARLSALAQGMRLAVVPAGEGTDLFRGSAIDLVIAQRAIARPNFRVLDLFRDGYVVVARPGHPATRDGLTLATYLAAAHVLVSPRGQGFRGPIDAALERIGRSRTVALALTSFWMVAEVVSRTDLIATVPAGFYRHCQGLFELAAFVPPLEVSDFDMSMFWHERHQTDPAHAWLRRMVREIAAETAETTQP